MVKVTKKIDIFLSWYSISWSLRNRLNDLPFFLERMNTEKVEKLVAKLHDKEEYVIHMTDLKQALNSKLILEKLHKVSQLNQKAWLKPDIDMNTANRKK